MFPFDDVIMMLISSKEEKETDLSLVIDSIEIGPANNINSLWPRQYGRHFADAIFKCIFLDENVWIPIKISLKFVPRGPINNIPALVQIMSWHQPGDKPLSEPMMVRLPTHICVTRPQWIKVLSIKIYQCLKFNKHISNMCSNAAPQVQLLEFGNGLVI